MNKDFNFLKKILLKRGALSAESFLLSQQAAPSAKVLSLYVDHGRIAHWTTVNIKLFSLALELGIKPIVDSLPPGVFPIEIVNEFRSTRPSHLLSQQCTRLVSDSSTFFLDEDFRSLLKILPLYNCGMSTLGKELSSVSKILYNPSKSFLNFLSLDSIFAYRRRPKISLHLRRGDTGILFKNDFLGTEIQDLFPNEVLMPFEPRKNNFANSRFAHTSFAPFCFLSYSEFQEFVNGQLTQAARWFAARSEMSNGAYLYRVDKLALENPIKVLFSDGFERHANFLGNSSRLAPKAIERVINSVMYGDFIENGFSLSVGETHSSVGLLSLLTHAYNSEYLINDESPFPGIFVKTLKSA